MGKIGKRQALTMVDQQRRGVTVSDGGSDNTTSHYQTITPRGTNISTVIKSPARDSKVLLTWSLICVGISIFVFFLATLQYVRKVLNDPKRQKKVKRKKESNRKAKEEKLIQELTVEAISAEDFSKELKRQKKKGKLSIEFKALARRQTDHPTEAALLPENRLKNSNNDVLPFDHSRVILLGSLPDQTGGDYINASFVESYNRPKAYIAAQGPNRHTVTDFWKMIWQEKVSCIVMATNVFEHARQQCEKYWHNQHGRYGDIDVWLDATDILADFTVRTFRVTKQGEDGERIIKQFQFASWSDHDCPSPSVVLEYRRRVRAFLNHKPGPILVHCSAGAGRTGAFIAIDAALERVSVEKNVDVFHYVLYLRNTRKNMVRTLQQYEFIYETVEMFLQCGVTVIKARELPYVVQQLAIKNPHTKLNGFEREFKSLQTVVPKLTVGECAGGHRAENRRKSRDVMVQPPERARPYLITHDSNDSTDYINALYVDGYRHTNAYIVTQWPVKSTVNDIWRLIYDYNIPTLVLLNDIPFSRSYPCFWPIALNQEIQYGPLTIECIEEKEEQGIASMLFRIRKPPRKYEELMDDFLKYLERKCESAITLEPAKYKDMPHQLLEVGQLMTLVSLQQMASGGGQDTAKVVRMFQLKCWPNKERLPSSSSSLIDLLTRVEDWQLNQCRGRIPTCVMSKNGVSRCGIYCAISISWDKLKAEGEVDIFRAVKTVKSNRPQLVENMVEYIFCYTFMVILLDILNKTQPNLIPVNTMIEGECWDQRNRAEVSPECSTKGDSPVCGVLTSRKLSQTLSALAGDESEAESCYSYHTANDGQSNEAMASQKVEIQSTRHLSALERFRLRSKKAFFPSSPTVSGDQSDQHKAKSSADLTSTKEVTALPTNPSVSSEPPFQVNAVSANITCDDMGDVYFPALPSLPPTKGLSEPDITNNEVLLSAKILAKTDLSPNSSNVRPTRHVSTVQYPVIVVNGCESPRPNSQENNTQKPAQTAMKLNNIATKPNGSLKRDVNISQDSIYESTSNCIAQNVVGKSSPSSSPKVSPSKKQDSSKSPKYFCKSSTKAETEETFQFDNPAYSQSFHEIDSSGTLV